jgi:hypothetical protein
MVMQTKDQILSRIAELVHKIQKQSKIGTAYEKYESEYLWDLGDQIKLYHDLVGVDSDAVVGIMESLNVRGIKCQPVLLKNAETSRRTWTSREEFLDIAGGVSYGKLKAVLPILDPEFATQTHVASEDLSDLVGMLAKSTYEAVLERVRKVRGEYDPSGDALDFDEFYQKLYSAIEELRLIVESKQKDQLNQYRRSFPSKFVEESRRLMAAMKSEESFSRLSPELFKSHASNSTSQIENELQEVIQDLWGISKSLNMRRRLRERVGISRVGELSALMQAASSDDALERHIRSQKLIHRLQVGNVDFQS